MSTARSRFIEAIDVWIKSDDGEAYLKDERIRHEIQIGRYKRFDDWLKCNDFDLLIYRLILKHDISYREKYYHNGFEPGPNNLLQFIFDYIDNKFEPIAVAELDCEFSNNIWLFKGYYFQCIYGQGAIFKIYNKADMREIISI